MTMVISLLLLSAGCGVAQQPTRSMNTLIDRIEAKTANAPVLVLFGGDPQRRNEVLRHLATLGDLSAYGALSEDEGYALLEQHKDRVKLVLIGGRYTAEQRVRIKAWCRARFPDMAFTEPGVDHAYDNELTKAAVKHILGLQDQAPMHKPIREHVPLSFKPAFPGLRGVDIMAHRYGIEPFLVLTEFHMERPVFGPHPHAGISVMTYMLPDSKGSFLNRDSQGDRSVIEPGGAHVTQAGSGIHHDEFPTAPGVDCHGFQIWIDHAADDRMVPPRAMHAFAKDIPEVHTAQHVVRVVAGSFEGQRSPFELVTPVTLLHVQLRTNETLTLPADSMAFVYVISGKGRTLDKSLLPQTLVTFAEGGDVVTVSASVEGVEFLFATGTPHGTPLVYGGPFVMSSAEQMHQARLRLGRGEMGELAPVME
jgi:hypothetical protein